MKKTLYLFFALSAFTVACDSDDLDDLLSISTTFTLDENFDVNISEEGPDSFDETIRIEASDNDLDELDKIEKYEITSAKFIIADYDGPSSTELEDMSISVVGTTIGFSIDPFEIANGTYDLNVDNSILEDMAEEFLKDNEIELRLTASVNNKPVSFNMTVELDVKVTGSPLN